MPNGAKSFACLKAWLAFFGLLVVLYGLAMLGAGIWMQADPRRRLALDYVNYYENDPWLRTAVVILTTCGSLMLIISLLLCFGALKNLVCLLGYNIFLLVLTAAAVFSSAVLSMAYFDKVVNGLDGYLYDMVHRRYGREAWVTEVVDALQFYHKCCGSNGTNDYFLSYWQITHSPGAVRFVPDSCCAQQLGAYPPHNLQPIDVRCAEFPYERQSPTAVYQTGCLEKVQSWIGHNCVIVTALAITGTVLLILTILTLVKLFRRLYYSSRMHHVQTDVWDS